MPNAPTYDLSGRTCFMSGATSGINEQVARRFAEAGAKVFVVSRSPEKVAATVDMLRGVGAEADGRSVDARSYPDVEAAVKACREGYGEIDMVLAGQAGNFVAGAAQMSANAFKSVIDIDLLGTFNVFRAAVHEAKRPGTGAGGTGGDGTGAGGASFIAISAPQATQPALFQAHVCAAKAGVNMLVRCLALEWGKSGVRVNAISPGPIDGTEGMDRLAPDEATRRKYEDALALKRFGSRDDIANAALWLCSDHAAYVTGTILEVEGGTTVGDATNAMTI